MNKIWSDYDFSRKSICEENFTPLSIQEMKKIVNSPKFEDMDSSVIFNYLFEEMRLVTAGDQLKRYIYKKYKLKEPFFNITDKTYRDIILSSFSNNGVPRSFSVAQPLLTITVQRWLHNSTFLRETVFLLGFGLMMSAEDVSTFLTKVICEPDFDFSDPRETIFWYYYHSSHTDRFSKAMHTLNSYNESNLEGKARFRPVKTINGVPQIKNDYDLADYLTSPKTTYAMLSRNDTVFHEFVLLLGRAKQTIAEMFSHDSTSDYDTRNQSQELLADRINLKQIENVLCNGIPLKEGKLPKASSSILAPYFHVRRLDEQRIKNILRRIVKATRFDLITLLFFRRIVK